MQLVCRVWYMSDPMIIRRTRNITLTFGEAMQFSHGSLFVIPPSPLLSKQVLARKQKPSRVHKGLQRLFKGSARLLGEQLTGFVGLVGVGVVSIGVELSFMGLL